jgi:L-asparaginase / beta-aspartyl-peptidase
MSKENKVVIVIHGGAWKIPDELKDGTLRGVEEAAKVGYEILRKNGKAIDAVEASIAIMEDDPYFDAGTGSVLNEIGNVEMDAMIMDGEDLSLGSVVSVSRVKNPIRLARVVKEKTSHVMFTGKGAERVGKVNGIEMIDPKSLVTKAARKEWERFSRYGDTVDTLFNNSHDTVGAIAMDSRGFLAAGTSTGGITAKREGRVGDSPVVGSGGYADNEVGATSLTGHGESILRTCLAMRIMSEMRSGSSALDAAKHALKYMKTRVGGCGGVICMDKDGNVGIAHTTERMAWACIIGSNNDSLNEMSLKSGITRRDKRFKKL